MSQIHLGGGTPTLLPPDQLRQLGDFLHDHFEIRDDAELAIEIDPRSCSRGHLEALDSLGFTRASLGIQSTDSKVQRAINREQPHERNQQVVLGTASPWVPTMGGTGWALEAIASGLFAAHIWPRVKGFGA